MNYFLFLSSLAAFTSVISGRAHCDACFDEICYSKETIFQNYPISGQLAVDRRENIIFFHYEDDHNHTLGIDLYEKKIVYAPDSKFSSAVTVDQATSDVFISDSHGILRFNPRTNDTIRFGLVNDTVSRMQYKGKIYFTIAMAKGLYVFDNNQSSNIDALSGFKIDEFVIDKRDDVYFISNFVLYVLKNATDIPNLLSHIIYSLATDRNNNVYLLRRDNRGLFKYDYNTGNIKEDKEVGMIVSGSPYTIAFDNYNNIIYYDNDAEQLLYLKPNYARCKLTYESSSRKVKRL